MRRPKDVENKTRVAEECLTVTATTMNSFARHVTSLSAYRKTEDHLTKRTVSGAIGTFSKKTSNTECVCVCA